jgi:hypothetical protein
MHIIALRWRKTGLPDAVFHTKPPNHGMFLVGFGLRIFIPFLTIWYTLWSFALSHSFWHTYFADICYIFPNLVHFVSR